MTPLYLLGGIVAVFIILSFISKREEESLRRDGLIPPQGAATMDHVRALMEKGHKIQAIKLYRKLHNVGLKDAKEAVEKIDIRRSI